MSTDTRTSPIARRCTFPGITTLLLLVGTPAARLELEAGVNSMVGLSGRVGGSRAGRKAMSSCNHGDTLHAFTVVVSAGPAKRDHTGVVEFKHWGVTHDDRLVFKGHRTVLVKRRPPSPDT